MINNYYSWILENKTYLPNIKDTEIVAATLIGEAGGEGKDGMHAIKNILDNRANDKGTSAAGEAIRPKQFSMWDSATQGVSVRSDYNKKLIKDVINQYRNHENWSLALSIASTNNLKDITKSANMYYAHNKIKPPYWTKQWKKTAVIGNHTFGIV